MKIADQIVLVTGGSRGLGAAVVQAFLGEGARVVINYRNRSDLAGGLAASAGPERAVALQADVTDPEQV